MHTKQWQAVCGYVTDVCESVAGSERTMRDLFDLITEEKNRVIYSWDEKGHAAYVRRDVFRRSVISVARKLADYLPEPHGMVGLHLDNTPFWPVCYWAILMSGHIPLIMDSRYELFHYRSLGECSGLSCITNDRNYPNVISPDSLKGSRSEVDSAFFDRLWADETVFACETADGGLRAVSHDGQSFCEQFRRLRHVYQYNQSMFQPARKGTMKAAVSQRFSDYFGLLCGIILYPCFNAEMYIAGEQEDIRKYLDACRAQGITHHCASAEVCNGMLPEIIRRIRKEFPRDAEACIAWLNGEERVNDYRLLSRYMSMSAKIRKSAFGKKACCILCTDEQLNRTASRFFSQLGIFFGNGCCIPELGLVSMELSGDPETRTGNSAGILLKGVTGILLDDGKLVLECGEHVGRYCTADGRENIPSPFPLGGKASFDRHNRLCILRDRQQGGRKKEPADPETVAKIRELYAAVLNKPAEIIEDDMDFFSALGGDSLSYFLLLQHIEIMFGIRIRPEERIYFSTARYAAETLKPYIQNKGVVTNNA